MLILNHKDIQVSDNKKGCNFDQILSYKFYDCRTNQMAWEFFRVMEYHRYPWNLGR